MVWTRFPADAIQNGSAEASNPLVQLIARRRVEAAGSFCSYKPFVEFLFPRGRRKPLFLPSPARLEPGAAVPGALLPSQCHCSAVGVRRGGQRDRQCSAETRSKVKNAPARLLRQRQPSIPGALPTVCKKSSLRTSNNSQIRCRSARPLPSGQG